MTVELTVEVINKRGLHARAAAKFVKVVAGYRAQVEVTKLVVSDGEENMGTVTGSSILGLMMLGADPGSKLHIKAEGDQADDVIRALKDLVDNRFGETE